MPKDNDDTLPRGMKLANRMARHIEGKSVEEALDAAAMLAVMVVTSLSPDEQEAAVDYFRQMVKDMVGSYQDIRAEQAMARGEMMLH